MLLLTSRRLHNNFHGKIFGVSEKNLSNYGKKNQRRKYYNFLEKFKYLENTYDMISNVCFGSRVDSSKDTRAIKRQSFLSIKPHETTFDEYWHDLFL